MKRLILLLLFSCPLLADNILVDVSLPPFTFFIREIGGEAFQPISLVPPGANPHAYEPTPGQVRQAQKAKVWFRIGEPFEERLLPALEGAGVKVVDLRKGLDLMKGNCPHCRHGEDLHFWMSVREAKIFSRTIADGLIEVAPDQRALIEGRLKDLEIRLDLEDQELKDRLGQCGVKAIVVSHPAFGYFCRDYGIVQLSVEVEGKEGGLKQINQLIARAKELGVTRVILQTQFANKGARLVAKKIGAETCTVDPLSEDYFEMLDHLAECLCPS
ncbi:MAG: metal ABC transporter solute-binding protein, Zn/Mn family [Parachlamydiales bacterium]